MAETFIQNSHAPRGVFDGVIGADGNLLDPPPLYQLEVHNAAQGALALQLAWQEELPPAFVAEPEHLAAGQDMQNQHASIPALRFGALLRKLSVMHPNDPRRDQIIQMLRGIETYARDHNIILPEDDPVEYMIGLIERDPSNSEEWLEVQREFENLLNHSPTDQVEEIDARIRDILILIRNVPQRAEVHQPAIEQPADERNGSWFDTALVVVGVVATAIGVQYFLTI